MTHQAGSLRALLLVATALGCGGGEPGETEAKAPYPAYSPSTAGTWTRIKADGTRKNYAFEVADQVTVGGATYDRLVAGDPVTMVGGSGSEVVGNQLDADTLEVIAGAFRTTSAAEFGVPEYVGATADAPITVELAPPIGVAQPFAVTGSTTLGSPDATPMTGEVTGSYTRTETGVTVDTPLGVVTGCDHFTATATVPFLFGATIEVSGDLWYSPQLGLVQATMAAPLAGLGMGLAGSYDKADLGDGWAAVTRVELHGGVNTDSAAFELSSLDYAGEFDADKNTHAKMYLEIRWADEAMAATDQMPFVSPEFGTVWGVFPFTLVMSPVSLLFPEDNARGLNHWIAYVDQAAKNEAENGIAYGVTVPYDPSFSGIRIAGRVIYKRLPAP